MAFSFKKSSAKSPSSTVASKASANPQPAPTHIPRPVPIDVHPQDSLKAPVIFPSAAAARVVEPDRIRARAFEIFMARGGKPGDAMSDWCQAERELRASQAKVPTAPPKG